MRFQVLASSVMILALVGACDNGGSAVATRDRAESETPNSLIGQTDAGTTVPQGSSGSGDEAERGTAFWTSTRRYSAQENAQRSFERNGAEMDAGTVEAYVAAAHEFIGDPPAGTQTRQRDNGDTLFYHAPSNTFAVATREGVPRTIFRPREGAAYWAEQQTLLNERSS